MSGGSNAHGRPATGATGVTPVGITPEGAAPASASSAGCTSLYVPERLYAYGQDTDGKSNGCNQSLINNLSGIHSVIGVADS